MDKTLLDFAGKQFRSAERILIVSHIRPDGDAIGSLIGFGLALRAEGKDVQIVSGDGVPPNFRHLVGWDKVRKRPQGEFDVVAVLDCSDLDRAGKVLDGYSEPDINIDHHRTNLNFAKMNIVDTSAVATAEILVELITVAGIPFSQTIASALLTGIITDTLGFRTSNMTPKALRIAADLMELGADLPKLYQKAMIDRSFEAARIWGEALVHLEREDKMVWTTLTLADRRAANYPGRDDADLINVLSTINDANISLIFVEQPNGRVKVSWRAQPGYDVSEVALIFGGGGHPSASGADIEGNIVEVKELVLAQTRDLL